MAAEGGPGEVKINGMAHGSLSAGGPGVCVFVCVCTFCLCYEQKNMLLFTSR